MEEDPDEILASCIECINGACDQLEKDGKYKLSDIKGIGITNQRESTCVWDKKTGKKLHDVVVWPDTRTTQTVKQLAKKGKKGVDELKAKVGSLMWQVRVQIRLMHARPTDWPAYLYLFRRRQAQMAA